MKGISRVARISQLLTGEGAGELADNLIFGPLVQDTDEVFAPSLANLTQILTVPLTQDTDTVFDPSVGLTIAPPLTQDTDTLFLPRLDMNLPTELVQDTDTVFDPVVSPAGAGVTVPLVQDADTLFDPTLVPGVATIAPPLVQDLDVVFAPMVDEAGALAIVVPLVLDTDTVFGPALDMNLPTELVQDVDSVFAPSIGMNLTPPLTQDADTVFDPDLAIVAGISVPLTQDADTVDNPTVSPGAVALLPPLTQDTDTLFNPTVAFPAAGITFGTPVEELIKPGQPGDAVINFTFASNLAADRVLLAFVVQSDDNALVSADLTCTLDGVAATQVANGRSAIDRDFPNATIFLVPPQAGSDVVFTTSAGALQNAYMYAVDVFGLDTGDPTGADVEEDSGAGASENVDIITDNDGAVVFGVFAVQGDDGIPFVVSTGFTNLAEDNTGGTASNDASYLIESREIAVAGTVTINPSWATTDGYTYGYFSLNPA